MQPLNTSVWKSPLALPDTLALSTKQRVKSDFTETFSSVATLLILTINLF